MTKQERISNGIKTVSSTNGVRKTDSNKQKNESGLLSYTIHKNKLKRMKDLHVRQEAIKILQEEAGKNFFDLGLSNFLLNTSPEAKETKAKRNYWDLIKIKSFCTVKETISKTKRENGRRYLQMTYQIKGKYPKSIKNLSNSTPKKQIIQSINGQKKGIDIFPKKTSRWPIGTRKDAQQH